ncbi:MAG: hypothetical protein HYV28_00745 [Ignavibacteriales bacterium]|nr:hypothetical protein [Ignavibacteriales bacterium]
MKRVTNSTRVSTIGKNKVLYFQLLHYCSPRFNQGTTQTACDWLIIISTNLLFPRHATPIYLLKAIFAVILEAATSTITNSIFEESA